MDGERNIFPVTSNISVKYEQQNVLSRGAPSVIRLQQQPPSDRGSFPLRLPPSASTTCSAPSLGEAAVVTAGHRAVFGGRVGSLSTVYPSSASAAQPYDYRQLHAVGAPATFVGADAGLMMFRTSAAGHLNVPPVLRSPTSRPDAGLSLLSAPSATSSSTFAAVPASLANGTSGHALAVNHLSTMAKHLKTDSARPCSRSVSPVQSGKPLLSSRTSLNGAASVSAQVPVTRHKESGSSSVLGRPLTVNGHFPRPAAAGSSGQLMTSPFPHWPGTCPLGRRQPEHSVSLSPTCPQQNSAQHAASASDCVSAVRKNCSVPEVGNGYDLPGMRAAGKREEGPRNDSADSRLSGEEESDCLLSADSTDNRLLGGDSFDIERGYSVGQALASRGPPADADEEEEAEDSAALAAAAGGAWEALDAAAAVPTDTLKHIVDGFGMEESSQPFPVMRSSLLTSALMKRRRNQLGRRTRLAIAESPATSSEASSSSMPSSLPPEPAQTPAIASEERPFAQLSNDSEGVPTDIASPVLVDDVPDEASSLPLVPPCRVEVEEPLENLPASIPLVQSLQTPLRCSVCSQDCLLPQSFASKTFCSQSCISIFSQTCSQDASPLVKRKRGRPPGSGYKSSLAAKRRAMKVNRSSNVAAGNVSNHARLVTSNGHMNATAMPIDPNTTCQQVSRDGNEALRAVEASSSASSVTSSPAPRGRTPRASSTRLPPTYTRLQVLAWSVDEVRDFIYTLEGCAPYAEYFRREEIDGSAFLLLYEDHLVNGLNIKLGPALKILSMINGLR